MHRVATAEDPPDLVIRRVLLVDVPQRLAHQLDLELGVADQRPNPAQHDVVGKIGLTVGHVEAPAGDPLVPGLDRTQQTHADLAETGVRVEDPVQDARPVRDVAAQVGVEHDVGGARPGQLTLERQTDLLGDPGAGPVEAQQVARPLLEQRTGAHVTEPHRDALGVLGVRQVLGVEAEDRATLGRILDQQRLHQRLRNVQHRARAALQVVTDPLITGAPGLQPHDLLAGQARGEQGVAHLIPRRGVLARLLLQPEVAQHLHRALVGDVGPRRVRHPGEHRHRVHADPVGGQRKCRRATRRAEAHHHNVGVVTVDLAERQKSRLRKRRCIHRTFSHLCWGSGLGRADRRARIRGPPSICCWNASMLARRMLCFVVLATRGAAVLLLCLDGLSVERGQEIARLDDLREQAQRRQRRSVGVWRSGRASVGDHHGAISQVRGDARGAFN